MVWVVQVNMQSSVVSQVTKVVMASKFNEDLGVVLSENAIHHPLSVVLEPKLEMLGLKFSPWVDMFGENEFSLRFRGVELLFKPIELNFWGVTVEIGMGFRVIHQGV